MTDSASVNELINVVADPSQGSQGQNLPQIQNVVSPSFSTIAPPQDIVSISHTAQQLAQSTPVARSTSAIVQQLHAEGVPTGIIAAELDSTPESVQSYLTVAALAASA